MGDNWGVEQRMCVAQYNLQVIKRFIHKYQETFGTENVFCGGVKSIDKNGKIGF
jgi:hypothetical protein